MADSGGITWDDHALQVNIAQVEPKVKAAIEATLAYHRPRAVEYARQNAPWRDRTSNARNGLSATTNIDHARGRYTLTVSHGVPYGIWLEVRWSGRYAIIRPTINHQGPLVMATAATLVRKALSS